MIHTEEQIHQKIEVICSTVKKAHKIARESDAERDTDLRHLLSLALQDLDYLKREI
jgi:hypothetical protein